MGSSRHFVALSFAGLCVVSGCGNLIGLGDYGVADGSGGNGAGTGNVAGMSALAGGAAGEAIGEGGLGGVPEESAGSAGESGASESGGTSGAGASSGTGGSGAVSGASGTSGTAGGGGAPAVCPNGCDDANDCTTDSCVLGACMHDALPLGSACGVSRTCDAQAQCVRCRDTAAGTAQDFGCTAAAPICLGMGLDAVCAGCTTATDCADGNDCTSETCSNGKCVFVTVAAGTACTGGVCNGTASAEKCVACADTAASPAQDAGCTPAKPACDPSGTATCYECLSNADCATDNVSCTLETCTNHQCSHVATDSKCSASGDVCLPNKCDPVQDCKKVDISVQKALVGIGSTQGNGGFEQSDGASAAAGWADFGGYRIVYNCGPSTSGCSGTNGATTTGTSGGDFLAWLGGTSMATTTGTNHLIALPTGTQKLQVIADINFQTKNATATNKDYFEVRLLDSSKTQVGAALYKASNMNAQTGSARSWTANAINATADVSAYAAAHVGEDSYISLWSSVDASLTTDFFIDNVRVTATICQ
ncbi:MAG TPA: hypothetical protein VFK05_05015 [Polyangiaceae bacterium]|nr:hypothetical protein [Polyangiaceae bacterium]